MSLDDHGRPISSFMCISALDGSEYEHTPFFTYQYDGDDYYAGETLFLSHPLR